MDKNSSFIDMCIDSGWKLDDIHYVAPNYFMLVPPEGDERINWAATWDKVPYNNKVILVPHWAAPGKYKANNE